MNKEHIADLIRGRSKDIAILADEPMKNHTSFKVGGPADLLAEPSNAMQIKDIIDVCSLAGISYFIMGNGTNIIVRDKGIRGVVIKLNGRFGACSVEGNIITAEAGILLSKLSNFALNNGLTGLEFASGIPGSLGGAIVMNAGAYGSEMKDIVLSTEYLGTDGKIRTLDADQHEYGNRTSIFQQGGKIVLKSKFLLQKGDKEKIKETMDELNRRRKETQPLNMPSAGSVFKRPPGYFAGKLIQDCNLRGFRVNGAQVSDKHCGFIVNAGDATADDIIKLVNHVRNTVGAEFNVDLQTEVKIVGEE